MEKHRGLPSSAPMHRTEHMLATARTQETSPGPPARSPTVLTCHSHRKLREMNTTSRRTGLLTLLVTSLGSFMVLLDGSIIFVALHEIQKDLGGELSQLQWTVDAYTLPFAALMLTAGTLGDRLGRKKVFLTGLVLFVLGSALCGFAPSVGLLILGRVVQGLGA